MKKSAKFARGYSQQKNPNSIPYYYKWRKKDACQNGWFIEMSLRMVCLLGQNTVIPPNSRFLGLRKGPRVWKPRIWVHIYVVKVKKGAEPFSKVHFLGDFEVRCSQMDVLPNKNAT